MARSVDMDNPRYRRTQGRSFGELCTRLRMENGEVVDGISCCYGMTSERTDDTEQNCKKCEHYMVWNRL